ncbi:MAG: hypothetical protein Q8R57_03920 [Bacteroidota bacterium]|nr:hypothetical protein [Bacteroidota bacterium]
MKTSYSIQKLFILVVLFTLGLSSCKKDLVPSEPKLAQPEKVTKTRDLKVSDNFKWETTNEMVVEITPSKSGLLLIQGENAEVFYKAFLQPGVSHTAKLTLQNIHQKMFVYFNGSQEEINISSGAKVKSTLK